MRRVVAAAALGALAACATTAEHGATGRGAQRAADTLEGLNESVPEAPGFMTEGLSPGEELLVVLPGADGGSSAVMLRHGEREVLVDQPYAAVTLRAEGTVEPSTLDSSAVSAQFS
ncbi:MAG: hypothetical protein ACREU7_10695, partial [Burkholderiales bacterium]